MTTVHVPILVKPIVEALIQPFEGSLAKESSHWIVDCTLGGGGHTAALLEALANITIQHPEWPQHRILALDKDLHAIEKARVRFQKELAEGRLELLHLSFGEADQVLKDRPVLGLMADLGFSSDQLDNAERGFSFQKGGPLDMRMNPSQGETCFELLDQITEAELKKILSEYGEERFSGRIARTIIEKRNQGKLPTTTQDLAELILQAVPPEARYGRIHAATRTFQALRIEVNGELSELDSLLDRVILNVRPGGRIAILSFHSLEDRKVKERFKDREHFLKLIKKPIQADDQEISVNPRSRSAKLRIAERKVPL